MGGRAVPVSIEGSTISKVQNHEVILTINTRRRIRMKFTFAHNNLNVFDLEKSLEFYREALGLEVTRTRNADDGSFRLAFLGDCTTSHLLELTWLRDMDRPYNLGDNEFHLAFRVDDFEAAYKKHKEMGVICYENKKMGLYFIADPDGYWLEIVPLKR